MHTLLLRVALLSFVASLAALVTIVPSHELLPTHAPLYFFSTNTVAAGKGGGGLDKLIPQP